MQIQTYHKPNMLIIQESRDISTSRIIRANSLLETVQNMIKYFIDLQMGEDSSRQSVRFDIQEAISYFELVFDLRYLQKENQQKENNLLGMGVNRMKVYDRKQLLDRFVDYLVDKAAEAQKQVKCNIYNQ